MDIKHELNMARSFIIIKELMNGDSEDLSPIDMIHLTILQEIMENDPLIEQELKKLLEGSKLVNAIFKCAQKNKDHIEKSLITAWKVSQKMMADNALSTIQELSNSAEKERKRIEKEIDEQREKCKADIQ